MGNRHIFSIALTAGILCFAGSISICAAQDRLKTGTAKKTWNPYSCCHDMTDTPGRGVELVEHHYIPEFYFFDTSKIFDTAYVYQIFDRRDSLLTIDTLKDFSQVHYISLYKHYVDQLHFYNDDLGRKLPLPISIITKRYDRAGKNKWLCITYPANKFSEIRESPTDIIHTDSILFFDDKAKIKILSLYHFYKAQ